MYRKITVNLYERQHLSLQDILACVGFSESTFWHILKLWRETGNVVSPMCSLHGRPRVLHCDDVLYLICLIRHHPGWFLDELLGLLDSNHFLECVGVSLKKLKQIVKERNEQRKMAFTVRMSQYSPEEIGFLDERMNCVSALGLMIIDGMVALSVVEGSFTTVKYLEFLQSTVVCTN
ncbi:hypothetical protein P692DRAFT_20846674 [Suillus brevipes Sb2]|nr:hypothetical protein P692DRAFT_20846674 [Suillus brevipes Sb2]